MNHQRRRFSNADKLKLLKAHFSDGVSIDELCSRHAIHPTMLYRWRRAFLSGLDSPAESSASPARAMQLRRRIKAIDSRISRLNDDVAYLKKILAASDDGSAAPDEVSLNPEAFNAF
jgi:transposase-like protein